eukprot:m.30809 g.30809  ORF g.30809 m.30809 type:complete len:175 (-) comp10643_c1_seq1:97-621(-)
MSSQTQEHHDAIWACRLPKPMTKEERTAYRATVSRTNLAPFHEASTYPITKEVEDTLEQMSLAVTQEEYGNDFWQEGAYYCSQCKTLLYTSDAKFAGPCIWPSFREPASETALTLRKVDAYNNYTCEVQEVYCGTCKLFVGHRFEDGRSHGDDHPDAKWRHCVLSLSLQFQPKE